MSNSFQDKVRARLRRGFANWNQGYDSWLEWCETLYEPDAHYNVYGQRLTLQEYKDLMGQFMEAFDIELGSFYNMLVADDWCAIRYSIHFTNRATGEETDLMNMEFVHFKDNPEPTGARVIEGWALSDRGVDGLVTPARTSGAAIEKFESQTER